jgi:hypothetical protein
MGRRDACRCPKRTRTVADVHWVNGQVIRRQICMTCGKPLLPDPEPIKAEVK